MSSKRHLNSESLESLLKKKKIGEDGNGNNVHFMVQQNDEESSSSKKTGSFSIDSLHEKLVTLSKRTERIEECIDMKTPTRTPIALPDIKSKNITSKSAFIGVREVWVPELSNKIEEIRNDIISKLNEMNNSLSGYSSK